MALRNAHHIDLPEAEYHPRPEWSQSQWKLLLGSPEKFHGRYIADPPYTQPETPAMQLGSVTHGIILEGKPIVVIPADVLTSNGQRRGTKWEQWKADHADNPGMLESEAVAVRAMQRNAMVDPEVAKYLKAEGHIEFSIFAEHCETGLHVRGRLDKWIETTAGNIVVDLKTCSIDPTNERLVAKHVAEYGYHLQAAHYSDLATALNGKPSVFVWIFAETSFPWRVRAWKATATWVDRGQPHNDIELGRRMNEMALQELRRRIDANDWHGDGFGSLSEFRLPQWAYNNDPLDVSQPYQEFQDFS